MLQPQNSEKLHRTAMYSNAINIQLEQAQQADASYLR
jgi:hypothetical protein